MPPRAVLAVPLAGLIAAGCGNERQRPPAVDVPAAPNGSLNINIKHAGVQFTAPENWNGIPARAPLVGGMESRRATLAVWRYRRAEPLPETTPQLERVRDLLVERVRRRDPTFELDAARVTRRAGAPAIEVTGAQTIGGRRVRVRSSHVFKEGAEVVLDAYAPPADFDRIDDTVFEPALRSLRLGPPETPETS